MNYFKNMFHRCKPALVAVNDEYHTSYTDTNKTVYHQMRFYRCECGKRTFDSNNEKTHKGIEEAKKNWKDAGVVPNKSYHPDNSPHYKKIDDSIKEQLDPVLAYQKTLEDIQRSLSVVINRDFDLESKYPELKKAADEYHRRLDKYRNFEKLKE
jgi:hypothetical protein